MNIDPRIKKVLIVIGWIALWQILAVIINNDILLAGPIETLFTLANQIGTQAFWLSIVFSFARIVTGFCIAVVIAIVCAFIAWRKPFFGEVLNPAVSFIKSVPVVCIIVLLLMWAGADFVSIPAVALMVFPPLYFSTLEGLRHLDKQMSELCEVYRLSWLQRLRYCYIPQVLPFVTATLKVVVGVSWKSGIATEIISIPMGSIGAQLYFAKITLDTAALFSWTLVIVCVSQICERIVLKAIDGVSNWTAHVAEVHADAGNNADGCLAAGTDADMNVDVDASVETGEANSTNVASNVDMHPMFDGERTIICDHVVFKHAEMDEPVIDDLSYDFEPGKSYCLRSPSGSGKTTLLYLIGNLLKPQSGSIQHGSDTKVSMMFQEDRLFSQLSAWENIMLTAAAHTKEQNEVLQQQLDAFIGTPSKSLAIDACSGGMKRKIALMRALVSRGDILILDEPFTGMDKESKAEAISLIKQYQCGRTLIFTTHEEQDKIDLGAQLVF